MESTQQGSERDIILFTRPWVVCFDPRRVDEGWTLRYCPDFSDMPMQSQVEDVSPVATIFALRHPASRGSWCPPLTDVTTRSTDVCCRYEKTEDFAAEITLWMRMATRLPGGEQHQAGSQDGNSLLRGGRISLALQTEDEIDPRLLFVHNINQVVEQEKHGIVISPDDLLRRSLLPGVFFDAQKEDVEPSRLTVTRYRCAASDWSLILYFYPAGVRRLSPVCFESLVAQNNQVLPQSCEEVWAITTVSGRLEKGVTAVFHGGFLLVPPSMRPSELSQQIRDLVLNESPLFEG